MLNGTEPANNPELKLTTQDFKVQRARNRLQHLAYLGGSVETDGKGYSTLHRFTGLGKREMR